MSLRVEAPTCGQIELRDRASGEILVLDDLCTGDDVADSLGPQSLDPTEELGTACVGEPYVCEIVNDAWDPSQCSPWPQTGDGDGDGDPSGDGDGDPSGDGDGDGETGGAPIDEGGGGCSSADTLAGRSAPVALGFLALLGLIRRRRS